MSVHREIEDLLPFYLNGTLTPEQTAWIARHVASCPRCAASLRAERRLADGLAALSSTDDREDASWRRLEAAITAPPARPWRLGWAVAVAAAAVAVAVALMPTPQPEFRTYADPGDLPAGPVLRVLPAEGTAPSDLAAALVAAGHAAAPAGGESALVEVVVQDRSASEIARDLRARADVRFVVEPAE